jgi:hypothetical protein
MWCSSMTAFGLLTRENMDWDNYFADADIEYEVEIKIVNTGDLVKEGKPK